VDKAGIWVICVIIAIFYLFYQIIRKFRYFKNISSFCFAQRCKGAKTQRKRELFFAKAFGFSNACIKSLSASL
jgi:hypothetical protein